MQLFRRRLWSNQMNGQYEKLEVINELTMCFVCPNLIKHDIFAIPFTFWLDLFHNLSMHSSKISLLAHVCGPYFISRTIPHRTFPDRRFPDGQFHKGISTTDSSPTDSSPKDNSPNGQFPKWTFPRRTVPRTTFPRTDNSPNHICFYLFEYLFTIGIPK